MSRDRNALAADETTARSILHAGRELAETSEQRHGIRAQPENTCQLIDKARACVEKCQRAIRNYERADEEELRDMISNVESELAEIIGWRSGLLEDIRRQLTEVRAWGQEWKDAAKYYWSKVSAEEGGEETHRTDEGSSHIEKSSDSFGGRA